MVAKSCRGCGAVCQGSICGECVSGYERRRNRPSPSQRGYDSEYRRNRLTVVDQAIRGRPCVICEQPFTRDELVTAEHIIPLRQGGDNSKANLGPAHGKCNYGWNRKTRK